MTEQEKFNAEVQIRLARQDAKFELFMHELQQQREDMRRLQDRQDEDRKSLEAKIDRLGDKIQNMVIAAVVGFGAIVFAAVSVLKH
ncbi:MAG: hypothetical protein IKD73_06790 [Selenomonadaceae bacterium]|nr:hypothetical protein [Selenomonadaceae bacterium]